MGASKALVSGAVAFQSLDATRSSESRRVFLACNVRRESTAPDCSAQGRVAHRQAEREAIEEATATASSQGRTEASDHRHPSSRLSSRQPDGKHRETN